MSHMQYIACGLGWDSCRPASGLNGGYHLQAEYLSHLFFSSPNEYIFSTSDDQPNPVTSFFPFAHYIYTLFSRTLCCYLLVAGNLAILFSRPLPDDSVDQGGLWLGRATGSTSSVYFHQSLGAGYHAISYHIRDSPDLGLSLLLEFLSHSEAAPLLLSPYHSFFKYTSDF